MNCNNVGRYGDKALAIVIKPGTIFGIVRVHGGDAPPKRIRHERNLSLQEREEISRGLAQRLSIREIAEMIAAVTGFKGKLTFDSSKPDGAMRKLMDVSRLKAMGWEASIGFEEGLAATYQWYLESVVVSQQIKDKR